MQVLCAEYRLPPSSVLMTVDRGSDFSAKEQKAMDIFARSNGDLKGGHSLWRYRNRPEGTTRAVNIYRGEHRGSVFLFPLVIIIRLTMFFL
jgi:hypothetical protein